MGLYGSGMHDWILDEMALGARVAHALDAEACGYGPLIDALLDEEETER